jgi:hypothetical protein
MSSSSFYYYYYYKSSQVTTNHCSNSSKHFFCVYVRSVLPYRLFFLYETLALRESRLWELPQLLVSKRSAFYRCLSHTFTFISHTL